MRVPSKSSKMHFTAKGSRKCI